MYGRAVNIVRKVKEDYDTVLADVDVLVMPTVPITARRHVAPGAGPLESSQRTAGIVDNTSIINGIGHPALSLPVGWGAPDKADILCPDDEKIKLPVAMQIVAKWWDEATCLKVAAAWEDAWDWKTGERKN